MFDLLLGTHIKTSIDLNNSRHYYNETNKRMNCSNCKISTLSKVRLFVLQAAKVLVGMVLIFEKIFHSIIFWRCWCFLHPPPLPQTLHVHNIFEKRWVGNHPKDFGYNFPCLSLIHHPIKINLVKIYGKSVSIFTSLLLSALGINPHLGVVGVESYCIPDQVLYFSNL